MIPFAVHTDDFFVHDTDQEKDAPCSCAMDELITVHFTEVIVPHFTGAVRDREPTRRPLRELLKEAGTPTGFDALLNEMDRVAALAVFPLTPKAHHPPSSPPIG
jgi:hypothetical protein